MFTNSSSVEAKSSMCVDCLSTQIGLIDLLIQVKSHIFKPTYYKGRSEREKKPKKEKKREITRGQGVIFLLNSLLPSGFHFPSSNLFLESWYDKPRSHRLPVY